MAPKRSKRQRRIRSALAWIIIGLIVLVAGGVWLERSRNTDHADGRESVTSAFTQSGPVSSSIRFTDVTDSLGLTMRHGPGGRSRLLPEDTGSGLAWGDYDGDGDLDLFVANFSTRGSGEDGSNALFENRQGHFHAVQEVAGVGDPDGFGMGASFADYDADGDLDLFVTNDGPNRLFENQGDGTFLDVADRAGVAGAAWSCGHAWGDVDRDGDLDLYVCNYLVYDVTAEEAQRAESSSFGAASVPYTLNPNAFDPAPNALYLSDGQGSFTESAEMLGVHNPQGRSLAVTLCDLDGDGWLDLYINNDVSSNRLYRNLSGRPRPDGSTRLGFEDVSPITGTADPRGSMGLSLAEMGGMEGKYDGLPDLFITHWIAQENALYQSLRYPGGRFEYRDKTRQRRLGEIALDQVGWGCALIDMDLDGHLDVVVNNGSTLEDPNDPSQLQAQPMFLFRAEGEQFQDVAASSGAACSKTRWGRGLAAADYDDDGDVDIALLDCRHGVVLLRNDTPPDNGFLKVHLDAPPSALFGASVEIKVQGTSQKRWLFADVSYLSQHAPDVVFGLGQAHRIERLEVTWADGKRKVLSDLPAGGVSVIY